MSKEKTDVIVIGGGIIGLAHAMMALKKGFRVILIEEDEMAVGASVRNFGLIWPIGQPAGPLYDRARRSRDLWVEMAEVAGFWAFENGSIHLAYEDDEWDVLEEYHNEYGDSTILLTSDDVLDKSPSVISQSLKGGLFSDTEVNVNPKTAIYAITRWLEAHEACVLKYGEKTYNIDGRLVFTSKAEYEADKILVCSGSDFQSLYPEIFATSDLIKSKLQMLRTEPQPASYKLGPTLCGGLTLRHYASFGQCKSLDVLKERVASETPEFDDLGIHVMVSQNEHNELIIGDSHEYGQTFDPFDKREINELILNYMDSFLSLDNSTIKETWHGVYAKNPGQTEFVTEPEEGVKIITGFGGAGMTFSFGYAEQEIDRW